MPRVNNLEHVLELVIYGLDDEPLAQHDLVPHTHMLVLHVCPEACDDMRILAPKHLEQALAEVSLVGLQLTECVSAELFEPEFRTNQVYQLSF